MNASSFDIPDLRTDKYIRHGSLLIESYRQLTGRELLARSIHHSTEDLNQIIHAPFALVSHGTEDDPIFNFANLTALQLFEMSWKQFTQLPSRKSAEPVNRDERQRLLDQVTKHGFIDDYQGIRISATGKRFEIKHATVWNLIDGQGQYQGQAATFSEWHDI